ncbi:hypothetical protein BKA69DRAFT_713294 [Paraphysoderma sedebokerense]|nr:hypothetical protein BKA69DRAFT_713294 [Paraphysoderma sedebokerense]
MTLESDIFRKPWKISPENDHAKIITLIFCFIGILLNGFLLYRFYFNRKNLKGRYIILGSMSVGDFLSCSCLGLLLSLHTILSELSWDWCQFVGMTLATASGTSGVSALFLSAERYIQIVHSKTFTTAQITIITGSIWFILITVSFVPLLTGAYYEERPCQTWCLPAFTGQTTKQLPFMVMAHSLLWTALIGIPFCYWRIYRFALQNGFKWGLRKGQVTAAVGPTASANTRDGPHSRSLKSEVQLPSQTLTDTSLAQQDALRSQLQLTKKVDQLGHMLYNRNRSKH